MENVVREKIAILDSNKIKQNSAIGDEGSALKKTLYLVTSFLYLGFQ